MKNQIDTSKGPGIYIPPPLFYVLAFIGGILIQRKVPVSNKLFHFMVIKIIGVIFVIVSFYFLGKSLRQFFLTKNTVILFKPASTLQTTGIYARTRNPMYVGLRVLYLGITCLIGNWWTLILFPPLILIIQEYIIKREERYLELEFGSKYDEYRKKVKRWI